MSVLSTSPATNPFAARQLRPGRIPFLFPRDIDWSILDQRLGDSRYRGQIVGPHGTGKSTLFAEWQVRLAQQGWTVVTIRLHNAANRNRRRQDVQRLFSSLRTIRRGKTIVMIDGYEQLARWQRSCVQAWLRFRAAGLLVTTHKDLGHLGLLGLLGLATLFHTQSNVDLACRVADRIAGISSEIPAAIPVEVVERLWHEHDGDIRETLFSLYDWCASDVPAIATPAKSA